MNFGYGELWAAFFTNLLIAAAYLGVVIATGEVPKASGLIGHGLGIVGFILMLMTETLYSLRKRLGNARWGRTVYWLKFHIYTGLVGSFMVLLHTSWKFGGLAGVVMLLTAIVVVSGFIGRYIYTALPRTLDDVVLETQDVEARIRRLEAELLAWLQQQDPAAREALQRVLEREAAVSSMPGWMLLWLRPVLELRDRWRWWWMRARQPRSLRRQWRQLDRLLRQRRHLYRQRHMLMTARRALAMWHTLHVPLSLVLFTLAFVHICAALYYATLSV